MSSSTIAAALAAQVAAAEAAAVAKNPAAAAEAPAAAAAAAVSLKQPAINPRPTTEDLIAAGCCMDGRCHCIYCQR